MYQHFFYIIRSAVNRGTLKTVHVLFLCLFLTVSLFLSAVSPSEEAAVFEEAEAEFEEAVSAPVPETSGVIEKKEGQGGSVSSGFSLPADAGISHVEDYAEPVFFPDRQPRTLESSTHAQLLAFFMVIAMAPLVTGRGAQAFSGLAKAFRRIPLKQITFPELSRKLPFLVIVTAMMSLTAGNASAITYSSVKDAVTLFLGQGGKVFQTEVAITPDAERFLKKQRDGHPTRNPTRSTTPSHLTVNPSDTPSCWTTGSPYSAVSTSTALRSTLTERWRT
ncbi:MAG: hypothetical protein WC799_02010 [Desulfobacteraceae bacterium]|jgi:hypothetical protein